MNKKTRPFASDGRMDGWMDGWMALWRGIVVDARQSSTTERTDDDRTDAIIMSANASSAITAVAGPASTVERVFAPVGRRVRMTTARRTRAAHPPVRARTARASATTSSGGAGGRETLSEGSRGEETYRLQQRLAEEGVLSVEDVTGCVQDAMRCVGKTCPFKRWMDGCGCADGWSGLATNDGMRAW